MLEVHPKNISTVKNIMKYVHRSVITSWKVLDVVLQNPYNIIEGRLKEKSSKWVLVSPFYIALEALPSL